MAITNAQAREKWLTGFRDAYASRLIFRDLTNRRFEGDAQNAYELKLNDTTAFTGGATETDRNTTRNPVLPVHQTTSGDTATLTMRYIAQESAYETDLDLLEGPATIMPTALRQLSYDVAQKVDERILTIVQDGIVNANDAQNTTGLRYGNASNYIDANGNLTGEDDPTGNNDLRGILLKLAIMIGSTYRGANYWKLNDPNFDERQPYIITTNGMWTAHQFYMVDNKLADGLTTQFVRSGWGQPWRGGRGDCRRADCHHQQPAGHGIRDWQQGPAPGHRPQPGQHHGGLPSTAAGD